MVFSVSPKTNKEVEVMLVKAMKELNDFFKIGWVRNVPKIFLLKDRKTMDLLFGEKTKNWVVGFCYGKNICLLNPKNYEAESDHKYIKKDFAKLLKHELCHLFISAVSGKNNLKPRWLIEGACVYLSGQYRRYKVASKLKNFLKFYDKSGSQIYRESGFAVKFLIEKYGKKKFLRMLKDLKDHQTKLQFDNLFKTVYGIDQNYQMFK